MKKRLTLFSIALVLLSLGAFSFINWNQDRLDQTDLVAIHETVKESVQEEIPETEPVLKRDANKPLVFAYNIDSRFESITKSNMTKATTIHDFIPEKDSRNIAHINSTEVILIKNDRQTEIRAYGDSEILSDSQKDLLKSMDYSEHFLFRVNYIKANAMIYENEAPHFGPHYTVVPETKAAYADGYKALITYIEANKLENTASIDAKKLRAVKVSFTISKNGTITNVTLDRTTNYPEIDTNLLELVKQIPGNWNPAKNANNEIMEDVLVLSFGLADGC
ncbi:MULTISPECIES: energy transducer TonB [Bizionia]|uniref:TonB C-terminal domain-containing protein n=1 Tax=Bizionia algoritergicola TaxID=291187 RepID=A0A5D0R3D6_9FLAO|nr:MULTISPECIES: hypothetical protein [Bizionia]OBX23858.1 hypothetical protein BAA08_02555 [Bizionia sp. APA-3]TYB75549.1 hypothetical protein ES675_05350 [Bizionia algoritergicola]